MRPTHRNLPLLLLRAREAAMAHFRPILKRFGLTDQQWRILRVLSEAGDGLEPGQIAESCKIQKPSLTGILSRMADMRLIDRDRSELDQRKQRISLTAKGSALVDRMSPLIDRQYQRIESMVGVDTLSDTYRTLDAMLSLLNRNGASEVDHGAEPWQSRARSGVGRRGRGQMTRQR
ncbi:MAG TPA: homoprotocatechuate degradation operon regulator HpaR [Casimicrobiaceae bacterium]|nr:homoprotocatechuate degradation operon regulator HpaR [Casimicrobiaceae bacterium]